MTRQAPYGTVSRSISAVACHGIETDLVHYFSGRRDNACLKHVMNRRAAVVEGFAHHLQGPPFFRHGDQSQERFGNNSEGSFRTRKDACQIVAGHILDGLTACFQNRAVRQHHFQTHDIIFGDTVLDGGDIPPAFSATLPPMVENFQLAGSVEKAPGGCAAVVKINRAHPRFGAVTIMFFSSSSRIFVMRSRERENAAFKGTDRPPVRPLAAPRGVTGMPC